MTKIFISQPMRDKTDEQIKAERKRAIDIVKKQYNDEVEIIDSFFEKAPHNASPLWYLGESLKLLGTADVAYFVKGWKDYRGCLMEYMAATKYNIATIEE